MQSAGLREWARIGIADRFGTCRGGSADSHSAERKEVCRKNKTLKREMYGQPTHSAPAVFSACQVQIFYSLSDAIFLQFDRWPVFGVFRVNGSMEELVSLLRVHRSEKDLWDPKNAIARGKKKRRISSCGSGRKKKPCQTRKSRKNGSGRLIFTNQTRTEGKQIYITQKNMLLRVWERKKAVSDPHIAMQAGKTPEIFEEQVCGNRKKPSKSLPAG